MSTTVFEEVGPTRWYSLDRRPTKPCTRTVRVEGWCKTGTTTDKGTLPAWARGDESPVRPWSGTGLQGGRAWVERIGADKGATTNTEVEKRAATVTRHTSMLGLHSFGVVIGGEMTTKVQNSAFRTARDQHGTTMVGVLTLTGAPWGSP